VNLEVAKMFIDQLAMIQEKTRGNLTSEESTVLRNALSNLQLAYVEVARAGASAAPPEKSAPATAPAGEPAAQEPESPVTGAEASRARSSPKVTAPNRLAAR
jgi:hypothetical protein